MASARPRTRPPEIVDRLNREINAALADPKVKARLADLGGSVLPRSPADFGKLIAEETKVGQGDPRGEHQGGMTGEPRPRNSISPVTRTHCLVLAGGRVRNASSGPALAPHAPPERAHHGPPNGP